MVGKARDGFDESLADDVETVAHVEIEGRVAGVRPDDLNPVVTSPSRTGGEKFGTEKLILEYVAARQKEREKIAPKKRAYNDPYYIDVRAFGLIAR